MPATIDLAHAGGTTGEWAGVLREVFGEYRAPTGVAAAAGVGGSSTDAARDRPSGCKALPGGPPRFLVAKPGLDGHSNGAEQIAVAARDAGMEVIYQGIRLTPEQIAAVARDEDVDVIGLSILSGSHLELVPEVLRLLREAGVDAPVVVGGIIPEDDRPRLRGPRRRRGLHAEGLRAGPDHGRDRRPGRGPPPSRPAIDRTARNRAVEFGAARGLNRPPRRRWDRVDRRAVIGLVVGLLGLALGAARRAVRTSSRSRVIAGAIALAAGVAAVPARRPPAAGHRAWSTSSRTRSTSSRSRSRRSPRPAATSRPSWPAASSSPPCAGNSSGDALTDGATGLFSEGYFTVALDARIAAARRQLEPVAVVLMEVIEGLESGLPRPANPKVVAECITAHDPRGRHGLPAARRRLRPACSRTRPRTAPSGRSSASGAASPASPPA